MKDLGRRRLEVGGWKFAIPTSNLQLLPSQAPRSTLQLTEQRGIALLIVVSMLTVIGIMGVAFAFSMRLETQAARQFVATSQARYVAEAGVSFARALLDEDRLASAVDDATEPWIQQVRGQEADVDDDGTAEARWRPVADRTGQTVGRFAVQIADEAAKGNLNTARVNPAAFALGAVNMTTLLEAAGVANAPALATQIEAYRYGQDQRPGVALVDDDRDGAVDDVNEYQPLALRGDDRLIEGMEEIVPITGLNAETLRAIGRVATVYSWDLNVTAQGKPRVNVNTATADELLDVMLDAGVDDPWQAAVNLADDADADLEMSRVSKSSARVFMGDMSDLGSWRWVEGPTGRYESDQVGGAPLTWVVEVPSGAFRVLALGLSGLKIGDMTVQGRRTTSVDHGESLGIFELQGTLEVTVTHQEPLGTRCAFRGLELVAPEGVGKVVVRGIEAVRINELMIEPTQTFSVAAAAFNNPQSSDWSCEGDVCSNSGVGQASWSWTEDGLRPGYYYLRVLGVQAGQTVGNVCVGSHCELLVHGQRHPATIAVNADGKFSLTIGKTATEGTYYIKGIELSLQPDAEYVELINLSDWPVEVGGWTLQGEATLGRVAQLPTGAVIQPHGLLVAAVDLADTQNGLGGNQIDAVSAWDFPDGVNAVQLEFPGSGLTPDMDWLQTKLPGGGRTELALRSGASVVDEVEFPAPLPTTTPFQSLEKGDPSVVVDEDLNGLDEGWYPSAKLYTPGTPNDNEGLTELDTTGRLIVHNPATDITVLNRPLVGVGELAGLPSGVPWQPFASADLAKVVDRLTVDGIRLEAEGFLIQGQDAWAETAEGYEHSDPKALDEVATLQWTGIPEGRYRFSVYGRSGEQFAVRWHHADLTYSEWTPELLTDAQGRIIVGQLAIGMGETPRGVLTLDVRCGSPSGICHVDHVRLDPRLTHVGRINVNLAPMEVLRALPGVTEAAAARIVAGRPYGNQGGKGWGIGDLLRGNVLGLTEEDRLEVFRQMGHLVTTRSNVFRILSLGEALEGQGHTPSAAQRIETVVQR